MTLRVYEEAGSLTARTCIATVDSLRTIFPKPYSIYLRGTISNGHGSSLTNRLGIIRNYELDPNIHTQGSLGKPNIDCISYDTIASVRLQDGLQLVGQLLYADHVLWNPLERILKDIMLHGAWGYTPIQNNT